MGKTGPKPKNPVLRFWAKVAITDSDKCWLWTAGQDGQGYGMFGLGADRTIRSHRFAYQTLIGEIPRDLVIDHLCQVRACVNPNHMELVTLGENSARGKTRWTHCPKGHLLFERDKRTGRRFCRTCLNARQRANRRRRAT